MTKTKCIIIISEKSSGSSVCQNIIKKVTGAKHVGFTRHFENETLYWTKAASILGKPQVNALDSESPLKPSQARLDLVNLLKDNIPDYRAPINDRELVFNGWRDLCHAHAPIFLEKSPHHIIQWSALELILECMELFPEIEFCIVGLIRNPMDTLYSQFKRWRTNPEKLQFQWQTGYQNLLKMKELAGPKLHLVRYEDMVSSVEFLSPVFHFCQSPRFASKGHDLHRKSISKWKCDPNFGFKMNESVKSLALELGYTDPELDNSLSLLWPLQRIIFRLIYKTKNIIKKAVFWRYQPKTTSKDTLARLRGAALPQIRISTNVTHFPNGATGIKSSHLL